METCRTKSRLFAVIAIGVIATLTLGALPVFVARISQSFELSIQQSGLLAMSDLGGCAIGCLISIRLQKQFDWQRVLLAAILVMCVGNLLSIWATGYFGLLSSRFLAGLGNGFAVSLVFAALCASSNPDRNFGFYTLGQLIAQAITISFFTILIDRFGIDSVFMALALASAAGIFLIPAFPASFSDASQASFPSSPVAAEAQPRSAFRRSMSVLALVGLGLYFWGFSSIWAFIEFYGAGAGLSANQIGRALGTASLVGIFGPILVVLTQPRIHRDLLLTIGVAAHILSIAFLMMSSDYMIYLVGGSLFLLSLNFVFPFQMGILAEFDRDGSMAVTALVVQLACLASGPYLGGLVLAHAGDGAMIAVSGVVLPLR